MANRESLSVAAVELVSAIRSCASAALRLLLLVCDVLKGAEAAEMDELMLHVRDAADVPNLVDALHDRWFDMDALSFDGENHKLKVPYWRGITSRVPKAPYDQQLVILHVRAYILDDPERIGCYSFNELSYRSGVIRIIAEPNLTLTVVTDELQIDMQPYVLPGGGATAINATLVISADAVIGKRPAGVLSA